MTRYKHPAKKQRLIKANRNTSWAPVFVILKKFGIGKKVHPSALGQKRSWRRNKLKVWLSDFIIILLQNFINFKF